MTVISVIQFLYKFVASRIWKRKYLVLSLYRWYCFSSRIKGDQYQINEDHKWWEQYKVMLNPQKSGIQRILNRAGKTKKIKNCANILEVKEYKYLGININQSLNFKELIKKIKIKSKYLKYNLRKAKNTKLTPRSRRLLLKTIYIKMVTYGWTVMYRRNRQYRDWQESALYQLTK